MEESNQKFEVCDVVVLKEGNLFPTKWPLARVLQVYYGKDGFVRVAIVTTAKGTYKPPVTKFVPLLAE